jgi:hypothetical protein
MNNRIKMTDSKFKCNIFFIFKCNSIYGQTKYTPYYIFIYLQPIWRNELYIRQLRKGSCDDSLMVLNSGQ